jgi:hypothetical protein
VEATSGTDQVQAPSSSTLLPIFHHLTPSLLWPTFRSGFGLTDDVAVSWEKGLGKRSTTGSRDLTQGLKTEGVLGNLQAGVSCRLLL